MKNKFYENKKILLCGSLSLGLLLTGCSTNVAKLAVASDEVVTLDASAKVNPSDYLSDIAEGAEVSYTIDDGIMTITVTKNDKTETFEVPIEIEEPNVSIDENITIDTYVGYDIEDYIHEDEGVTHTTNFDEETGALSVTFEKGEWSTTLDSQVDVTSSDPIYIWPKNYHCLQSETDVTYDITIYEDGSFVNVANGGETTAYGNYTFDGNNWYFDFKEYNDLSGSGNYNSFTLYIPRWPSGTLYSYCNLAD